MNMFLRTLAFTVLGAACCPGQTNLAFPPVRIEGLQTNLVPVLRTVYLIAGPDLYKSPEPGPASHQLGIAWRIGNEFVFRTSLRGKYKLPAGRSQLLLDSAGQQNGDALISFRPKEGDKELTVLVHWRNRTVEIASDEPTRKRPTSQGSDWRRAPRH